MNHKIQFPTVVVVDQEFAQLMHSFVESRKENIARLTTSLQTEDWQQIQSIGHVLAGVCGSFGFDALGEAGTIIEEHAKHKNKSVIAELIPQMSAHIASVKIKYE